MGLVSAHLYQPLTRFLIVSRSQSLTADFLDLSHVWYLTGLPGSPHRMTIVKYPVLTIFSNIISCPLGTLTHSPFSFFPFASKTSTCPLLSTMPSRSDSAILPPKQSLNISQGHTLSKYLCKFLIFPTCLFNGHSGHKSVNVYPFDNWAKLLKVFNELRFIIAKVDKDTAMC